MDKLNFFFKKFRVNILLFWSYLANENIFLEIWEISEKNFVHVGAHCAVYQFGRFFCKTMVLVSWQSLNSLFTIVDLGFIVQIFFNIHPPICRIKEHAIVLKVSFISSKKSKYERCKKNGLHGGDSNPPPLGQKYSPLTARSRNLQEFSDFILILITHRA